MAENGIAPHIAGLGRDLEASKINRREFVRLAALLGMAAPAAYAMAGRIAGGGAVPGAAAQAAPALPQGGTLRVGNRVKEIKSPHTYSWGGYDSNMSRQVVEYLTFTDYDGVTKPYLFESWEVTPDLKTWTFKLRRGVTWRNGEALTADHVVWNLRRVLDAAVGSSMVGLMKGYMLDDVTGADGKPSTALWDANAVEKVDDFTVRLNCKVPQVAVPEHLFQYPMSILHPDDKGVFGVGAQGTGAFELVEFELGKRALFRKRRGYWAGDAALDAFEHLDTGDDPTAAIAALASRQLDGLVFADPVQYAALNSMPHLRLYSVPTAETAVMRMKVTEKPFDDPRVRQAFRLATEPAPFVEIALRGLGIVGEHHHVSPAHPEYAELAPAPRDVAAARRLLAEAGHPNGLATEIYVPTDLPWIQTQVEIAVEQWKEAGIDVKINLMPGTQYWDVWTKVPMGATIWYHRPLGIMTYGLAYRTGSPWNESSYTNAEFDALLTEAEGVLEADKRREIMTRLERIIQEDGPIVQPIFRSAFTFMDSRVEGFQMHPVNFMFGWRLGIRQA